MARLILVRHGATDWNWEGRYLGQSDTPLNEEGIRQAHRLIETLNSEGISRVVSSDLKRASETARNRIHGIPSWAVATCVANAAPVGQAFGRIGCFLVGDDYVRPTDLPWGVAFPRGAPPIGVPVHPTQLYEVAWLLPGAGFLWWRRKRSPFLFGEYLALNGAGRIVIEHWRVNDPVLLGLTEPQVIGVALIAFGTGGWLHFLRAGRAAAATRG